MSRTTEKIDTVMLPVIPLHDAVAFPAIPIDFETDDESAVAAADTAVSGGMNALLLYITDDNGSSPELRSLARVGTIVNIRQCVHDKDRASVRLLCEGRSRASVADISKSGKLISASVLSKTVTLADNGGVRGEAYASGIRSQLDVMAKLLKLPAASIKATAGKIRDPGLLSDFVAASVLTNSADKQRVLEEFDPLSRCGLLIEIMKSESELLECEREIQRETAERVAKSQRDYFLREQIKVIEDELGEGQDPDDFTDRINSTPMPEELREKLLRENDRLMHTPYGSAEATVSRNYLEEVLEIPWEKRTRDRINVKAAEKILDADHDGLEKVKERILEFLAVKQLNPKLKNQIICLVGPPGTGKTSVAASMARAMNRKYVRVSLGGIHDEAEIRGHRKTYVASMPGRIIAALKQVGVCNPLMLLDEIDKLTSDMRGDPASALLEVLDPEQNKAFRDHFVEYPFDLSDCFFITTANTTDTIPRPLLDRMEVIELNGYTRSEKLRIAQNHLLPKQIKRHGLSRRQLKIEDGAIYEIIDCYTREAGVRNLERSIADICRKAAKRILDSDGKSKIRVSAADVASFLGGRKIIPETVAGDDLVGVVNGLAYTEAGGDLLKTEVAVMEGTGKLQLTGKLGDVMKESAQAALTYVRTIAAEYGIPTDFYRTKDIHIHFPEGAVPKDGPSAGVTVVTALVSALSDRAVRHDVAMTGEVTITGRVLAIGGLREKTMAAYAAGVHTVLIPAENMLNLDEVAAEVKEHLVFIPCKTAHDVLDEALLPAAGEPQIEAPVIPVINAQSARA